MDNSQEGNDPRMSNSLNNKRGRKTSTLWDYFTSITDGKAKCDICEHELSYKSTTTNLRKHLDKKHKIDGYKPRAGITYILTHPGMKTEDFHEELIEVEDGDYDTREDCEVPETRAATPVIQDINDDHRYSAGQNMLMERNLVSSSSHEKTGNEVLYKKRERSDIDSGSRKMSNSYSYHPFREEDEFDITGRKLSFSLRAMEPEQRVFAEKLMSDIIYFAKLNKLTERSTIQVDSLDFK